MEDGEYGLNELFEEVTLESPADTTEEEKVDEGGPYELTEEEADEMFVMIAHVLKEEEENEKEEKELGKWLTEWKVLTDEAEEMLKSLGYKDEIVHIECFEEIMSGEEIDSDEEIEFM